MVSADNLNLDVLELIFAHLSGNDLSSVALVSRSFLAGVIPRLYNTLSYRLRQGKGYALVCVNNCPRTMFNVCGFAGSSHIAICCSENTSRACHTRSKYRSDFHRLLIMTLKSSCQKFDMHRTSCPTYLALILSSFANAPMPSIFVLISRNSNVLGPTYYPTSSNRCKENPD